MKQNIKNKYFKRHPPMYRFPTINMRLKFKIFVKIVDRRNLNYSFLGKYSLRDHRLTGPAVITNRYVALKHNLSRKSKFYFYTNKKSL